MVQIFVFCVILPVGCSKFSYFGASYAWDGPDFHILEHLTRRMIQIFVFCTILRVRCSGFSYFAPSYASDAPDFHILHHLTRRMLRIFIFCGIILEWDASQNAWSQQLG